MRININGHLHISPSQLSYDSAVLLAGKPRNGYYSITFNNADQEEAKGILMQGGFVSVKDGTCVDVVQTMGGKL